MRRISSLYTSYVVWFVLLHLGPPHCDLQFLDSDEQSKENVFKSCQLSMKVWTPTSGRVERSQVTGQSAEHVANKLQSPILTGLAAPTPITVSGSA